MNLNSTIRAFFSYVREFGRLPFDPLPQQFPSYLFSYLEGRLASRGEGMPLRDGSHFASSRS